MALACTRARWRPRRWGDACCWRAKVPARPPRPRSNSRSRSPADRAAQESQTRKKERTPRLDWARLLHGPPFGGREIRARITPCKLGEAACSREYEGILHG